MGYKIRDGDIYKIVVISDNRFTIRYGYLSDAEREKWEPTPIYPDFISEPVYTADGFSFATAFQDVCEHFKIKPDNNGESWCDNCIYFDKREDYIGLCKCEQRRHSRFLLEDNQFLTEIVRYSAVLRLRCTAL